MDPKLKCLDINWSADKVAKYIDRFNFWIDTSGPSDEKAIRNSFLTVFGKEAFSLPRTLNLKGRFSRRNPRSISAIRPTSPV